MKCIERRNGEFYIGERKLRAGDLIEVKTWDDPHPQCITVRVRIDGKALVGDGKGLTVGLNYIDHDCPTVAAFKEQP
jgi:hypothetical protein